MVINPIMGGGSGGIEVIAEQFNFEFPEIPQTVIFEKPVSTLYLGCGFRPSFGKLVPGDSIDFNGGAGASLSSDGLTLSVHALKTGVPGGWVALG